MINPETRYIGIIYAVITAFFWGFLAIALKVAVGIIGPYNIVWFRFTMAFSVLFLYFLLRNKSRLNIIRKPPFILIIAAVCVGLNYIGFMQGINYSSPGNAQILIQTGPIMLALVGVIIFKEKLSRIQYTGFLLAGIGLYIFYSYQIENLIFERTHFDLGVLFTLSAAICWVIYASLQKTLVQKFPPQQLNLIIYGIPILMYLPLVDFPAFAELSLENWLLLIFLGLNTLIAYGSLAESFKYVEANKVSIIITLNPVITFILISILTEMNISWVNSENLSIFGFLGGSMVLLGAILAIRQPGRQGKS